MILGLASRGERRLWPVDLGRFGTAAKVPREYHRLPVYLRTPDKGLRTLMEREGATPCFYRTQVGFGPPLAGVAG